MVTSVDLVERMITTIPEDDDHPYRTGAWRPQQSEWNADDLEVVEGSIPADLDGVYLRNTENPLHLPISRYHPFDGDGMVHMVGFRDGKAFYRNRFVRTDGLAAEQEAGRSLWAGISEAPESAGRTDGVGARGFLKDSSSTDVTVFRGEALTSYYQCGDLYRMDPITGRSLGRADFNGAFPREVGVSAHPKNDDRAGELLFFNYGKDAPYMHYGVVDANNDLVHYVPVELPGPRLPHDMAFTENYVILNDFPLFWDAEMLRAGHHVPRLHPGIPSRFAVLPRRGDASQVRWFEADPTYVLHFVNAFEEGDEIVLDGFFQHDPEPSGTEVDARLRPFRYLALDQMQTRLHRWRFDLVTGAVREESLTDTVSEFGMMNADFATTDYRYAYAATGKPGWFLFNGLVRHDLHTGAEEHFRLDEGVFASETSVAPKVGATAEDEAYLVTITTDVNEDASYGVVFDAARLADGPVCRVKLPERVSSGTHSTWAPGAELRRWRTAESAAEAVEL
ncbi:putative dioxygenase [Gordonia hirsuta DSM 44140 = NBRC 16056]|uniref:Dioxygenase n=1 Tax=Gordonia hirsuta DSM 44140 = NBRC 16056 TaxID=1121927 RepID=L7L618_9ACTN|nr:carotenoid oxygenase family protein [Gordonia hirsuta]GAC56580.1 putative dioxygenase [Gordonia hirsuta DSM 44140 = NBRC 16056]